MRTNDTHDPALESWVDSANEAGSAFPIQNLPFAIARRRGSGEAHRPVVAIGDQAVDLAALAAGDLITGALRDSLQQPTLNALMARPSAEREDLRAQLSALLCRDATEIERVRPCLLPQADLEFALPARIGDYTDFYASIYHAENIGRLFRPDNPLLPNYDYVPIGYHGRSSSIVISKTPFHRPVGQLKAPDADAPTVAPCRRLDYELEVGIFVAEGNALGAPIPLDAAEEHIFGLCLLNDWSARDVQAWEYQPLGPFLAKNFASSISPWIVTVDALAPFRTAYRRDPQRPAPPPYLTSAANSRHGAVDLQLEVLLETERMRSSGTAPERISRSNFADAYWTMAQMVTHHSMGGCNLQPGDLFGSGTMSGSEDGSQGALIEITRGGKEPLQLANGETRTFLEDGDRVVLRAWCERDGATRIGLGEVSGTVLPAAGIDT